MNIWFTSDTHFGHGNLVRGVSKWSNLDGCRDFKTVLEHDETILENINSLVKEDDTFYHLGDFCLGCKDKAKAYIDYRNRIKCKNIIFILGNHDLDKRKVRDLNVFSRVHEYRAEVINGKFCAMFHYPILSWNHLSGGSYQLSGHTHNTEALYPKLGRMLNVGLDAHNFKPWSFDEIDELLSKVEVKHEGHH